MWYQFYYNFVTIMFLFHTLFFNWHFNFYNKISFRRHLLRSPLNMETKRIMSQTIMFLFFFVQELYVLQFKHFQPSPVAESLEHGDEEFVEDVDDLVVVVVEAHLHVRPNKLCQVPVCVRVFCPEHWQTWCMVMLGFHYPKIQRFHYLVPSLVLW